MMFLQKQGKLVQRTQLMVQQRQLTQQPQRKIYALLYRILTQQQNAKKPAYKAFDYDDDLKRELT